MTNRTLSLLLAAAALAFASTQLRAAGIEAFAGQYKMTEAPTAIENSYGAFEASADGQPASIGAAAYQNFGKFKVSLGARTGDSTYTAPFSDEAGNDITNLNSSIADLDSDIADLVAAEAPLSDIEPLQAELAVYGKERADIYGQFKSHTNHAGLTASAMYAVTDNISAGAEVFANQDTDEVIPSLKLESASKHGNMTLGATLNAGEDWVGFGSVVRF